MTGLLKLHMKIFFQKLPAVSMQYKVHLIADCFRFKETQQLQ